MSVLALYYFCVFKQEKAKWVWKAALSMLGLNTQLPPETMRMEGKYD